MVNFLNHFSIIIYPPIPQVANEALGMNLALHLVLSGLAPVSTRRQHRALT